MPGTEAASTLLPLAAAARVTEISPAVLLGSRMLMLLEPTAPLTTVGGVQGHPSTGAPRRCGATTSVPEAAPTQ